MWYKRFIGLNLGDLFYEFIPPAPDAFQDFISYILSTFPLFPYTYLLRLYDLLQFLFTIFHASEFLEPLICSIGNAGDSISQTSVINARRVGKGGITCCSPQITYKSSQMLITKIHPLTNTTRNKQKRNMYFLVRLKIIIWIIVKNEIKNIRSYKAIDYHIRYRDN